MKLNKSLLFLVLLSSNLYADTQQTQQVDTQQIATQQMNSEQLHNQQKAQEWGLTLDEYQRYQSLISGRRGIQSPNLDPITTLGIEAQSEQERQYYADKWVQQEFARTEKELAFQREVNLAWSRNYPNLLPITNNDLNLINDNNNGRLALFVSENCERCAAQVKNILASKRPVDIYLVNSNDDDEKVRKWAKDNAIPGDRVMSKEITLNHDKGEWFKFGQGKMPVVLQQGAEGWSIAAF